MMNDIATKINITEHKMCEPIIDEKYKFRDDSNTAFEPATVKEFLAGSKSFKEKFKHPLRHYSQLNFNFDSEYINQILEEFEIKRSAKVTVFGGYTGQFAKSLRDAGFSVTFTDPILDYVACAKKEGYEAHKYRIEDIPSELVKKTDLFATFECYIPFINEETGTYTTMRLLSAKYGLIFAESKDTINNLQEEGPSRLAHMKFAFKPFADVYGITRCFKEKDKLRIYHFCAPADERETIKTDCRVIKSLFDLANEDATEINHGPLKTVAKDHKINQELVDKIARHNNILPQGALESINRYSELFYLQIPKSLWAYFPKNNFSIYSKRYTLNI